MIKWKRKAVILPGAALIALLAAFFLFSPTKETVSYLTEKVRRGELVQTVTAVGEVGATQLVKVGSRVSGQITRLRVKLGQQVKKGDLVAEIDSTTQENDLKINKAKLETYKAQLEAKKIALRIAAIQYQRELNLKKNDSTSRENLETAENTLALAKAEVNELESLIVQSQVSVSTAEINLGYTRIAAPLDGTVVSLPVEEGQTLNANQTTPTIALIADLSAMQIKIEISEGDITKISPGLPVSYTILSEPDQVFHTSIQSVDPGLTTLTDGTYSETGSTGSGSGSSSASSSNTAVYYYGNLLVPNQDGKLRIGMTTQNVITITSVSDALIVPSIAVQQHNGKKLVNVLTSEGKVLEKEIKTGVYDNMSTQVLSGLGEGEEVIAAQMSAEELKSASASTRVPRMRR